MRVRRRRSRSQTGEFGSLSSSQVNRAAAGVYVSETFPLSLHCVCVCVWNMGAMPVRSSVGSLGCAPSSSVSARFVHSNKQLLSTEHRAINAPLSGGRGGRGGYAHIVDSDIAESMTRASSAFVQTFVRAPTKLCTERRDVIL